MTHVHSAGCGHIIRYTDANRRTRGGRRQRTPFERAQLAERQFAIQLRKIARHIGHIIEAFPTIDPDSDAHIQALLRRYSQILRPWAAATSLSMVEEVNARTKRAFAEVSAEMSHGIRRELQQAPVRLAIQQLVTENVERIAGIPLQAAERVHKLTIEGLAEGTRAKEIAAELLRGGHVAASNANMIAQMGVMTTATALTKVRAEYVGSTHFVWKSLQDAAVRPLHKALNNKTFRWDSPPVADERTQTRALPGAIWNCRCIADPVLSDPGDD